MTVSIFAKGTDGKLHRWQLEPGASHLEGIAAVAADFPVKPPVLALIEKEEVNAQVDDAAA